MATPKRLKNPDFKVVISLAEEFVAAADDGDYAPELLEDIATAALQALFGEDFQDWLDEVVDRGDLDDDEDEDS